MKTNIDIPEGLDVFDPQTRMNALQKMIARTDERPADTGQINMHLHTFFSYNANNWSPSHVAWECRQRGLHAAAICDFDVLDGLEEFLAAGRLLEMRYAVHLETRAFFAEHAANDISSPGEPGVTYIMGGAFPRLPPQHSAEAAGLAALKERAGQRNLALIERINAAVPEIAINYRNDVIPLTPAGGATERHIITAYRTRIEKVYPANIARKKFLAELLKKDANELDEVLNDIPALEEALRSRLAKRGGIGYQQPSQDSFPPVEDFVQWVINCNAIPLVTWLDGTSKGENDPHALLDTLAAKGCAGLNIIPERNWNLKNTEEAAIKRANLDAIINAAIQRHMPVIIGTEMNKAGLPFCDDINGPVLSRWSNIFTTGAHVMVGHTLLARYAGFSYTGKYAAQEFNDIQERNRFFAAVGALPPINLQTDQKLRSLSSDDALAWFHDSIKKQ